MSQNRAHIIRKNRRKTKLLVGLPFGLIFLGVLLAGLSELLPKARVPPPSLSAPSSKQYHSTSSDTIERIMKTYNFDFNQAQLYIMRYNQQIAYDRNEKAMQSVYNRLLKKYRNRLSEQQANRAMDAAVKSLGMY